MKKHYKLKCFSKLSIKVLIALMLLLGIEQVNSQQLNVPLSFEVLNTIESASARLSSAHHTSFKPYTSFQINDFYEYDSLLFQKDNSKSWLRRKLLHESFLVVDTGEFQLAIDPLITLERSYDPDNSGTLFNNTRGVLVKGNIGKSFSFETSFYESQARFQRYIDQHIRKTEIDRDSLFVIPGQGRAKKFKKNAFDFASSSGYVSYAPIKNINLQVGHGKHFIGDGYRSLLLSDNAFNYPYFKATASFGKFNYTVLYSSLMVVRGGGIKISPLSERIFQKKSATFHYLSFIPFNRLELGLFEGTIWRIENAEHSHFNFNILNPVIGSTVVQNRLNGNSNVLLGLNGKFKLTNGLQVYGQFMLDDLNNENIDGTKAGYQAGLKFFDLFKLENLYFQLEYNHVNRFTYAHKRPVQSYTHYNQPLAHPLGAGFNEAVSIVSYSYKRLNFNGKLNYAEFSSYSGSNIFDSDNNIVFSTDSLSSTITNGQFTVSYLVNPITRLNVYLGVAVREEKIAGFIQRDKFIFAGIKTSLRNIYFDF